ncbi:hypothetical protein N7510_008166 [Penicillium lagena]|uniref:uncharacterized protein n=1 Tax=Penicillium lagena TaxID=94218 RepID=UPI002540F434|nr:uncharacterized protein N7510_008166 [Penicillium lagena]KAJ5605385.1 hypothetical protein N7510_008166 [Penicillium lagena]
MLLSLMHMLVCNLNPASHLDITSDKYGERYDDMEGEDPDLDIFSLDNADDLDIINTSEYVEGIENSIQLRVNFQLSTQIYHHLDVVCE